MKKIVGFLFVFAVMYCGYAQDTLQRPTIVSKETNQNLQIYKTIQTKSQEKKITNLLHKLIFNSSKTDNNYAQTQYIEKSLLRNFKQLQGKPIRNIHIQPLDPLGFSEIDSLKTPNKWERFANVFHNKTKKSVVEKLLLFKKNEVLDSLLVKESERLLREQSFVRSALIMPQLSQGKDSVDVTIRVLDTWTMVGDVNGSVKHFSLSGKEYNFLGLGHEIAIRYRQELSSPYRVSGSFSYIIPNLFRKNIFGWVLYDNDFDRYYTQQIGFQRNYFSPLTRWAGGVNFTQRFFKDEIYHNDSVYVRNFKTLFNDIWASVSFPILKKYTKGQMGTNLILAGRFFGLKYQKKIEYELDKTGFFSNKNNYLFSVGISNIGYEQDRYVFKHQEIEDIPVGKVASAIMGGEITTYDRRGYLGFRAMYGSYWRWGYVSADIQAGTFFYQESEKQTTIKTELNYFSKLFYLGGWNVRQFVKFRSVIGFSRKDYLKDRISLNGSTGMEGFFSPLLLGTRKQILSLQTQFYTPFLWKGFRISPFAMNEIGAIGQQENAFFKDVFIPKVGIGFYVTNDYIRFGNFQFSFFYFPRVPGIGDHIHKFSGTNNHDFSLPNFNFKAPSTVRYE